MVTKRDRKSFGSRRAEKKIRNLLSKLTPLTFFIRVQAFRDPLCGELPHVEIFMNDGPNPLMWDAQFFSYSFSLNGAVFQDKPVNFFNNIRGGHCFGSSIMGGKSLRLNWANHFLKVTHDAAGSPNFSVRMAYCATTHIQLLQLHKRD